ncbi:M20/M25/M40 family metallo-hydrolase, partial [Streptomyces diastaticus]
MSREPGAPAPAEPTRDLAADAVPAATEIAGTLPDRLCAELIAFRRDLHMHPELGNQEFRTTLAIKTRLEQAGLQPRVLDSGTGLICDIGTRADGDERGMLALRADIDALPIPDTKADAPYRSTVPDRAHACGHDVHTTTVLGAGLVLAALDREGKLPHPVRLLFQPAEEVLPGGAPDPVDDGLLAGRR